MASEKASPALEIVSASISKELAQRVKEAAKIEDRSTSNWIKRAIIAALEKK